MLLGATVMTYRRTSRRYDLPHRPSTVGNLFAHMLRYMGSNRCNSDFDSMSDNSGIRWRLPGDLAAAWHHPARGAGPGDVWHGVQR